MLEKRKYRGGWTGKVRGERSRKERDKRVKV